MLIFLQIQNPSISPGSGTFISHSFEIILICLIMFLLGWFLHHVIFCSRHKIKIKELEGNLKSARTRINDLEGDLESCNAAVINLKGENASLGSKLSKLEREGVTLQETPEELPDIEVEETRVFMQENPVDDAMIAGLATDLSMDSGKGFDANAARAVFGKHIMEDDLQIVEGIGPKTELLLNNNSIHTWRQLGSTSVPQIQNVLLLAGDRFKLLNPSTWPKQARMAADGEWRKLKDYQDYLIGGVEPAVQTLEGTITHTFMGALISQDDLTIVEGIGPKIEELLRDQGIDTWLSLSQADITHLKEILNAAGEHYRIHDPGTWPKQARLAYDNNWTELEQYQDYLKGGKEPT